MSSVPNTLDVETIGNGPALVFIHGAGGNPRSNFPFLDQFSKSHTVIAPCLPGSGGTPRADQPLTTRSIAHDIGNYLADQEITDYAVVGYSMGSTIAIELAAAYPNEVTAVALTAGFAHAQPSLLNFIEVWEALMAGCEEALGRAILSAVLKPETLDDRGNAWLDANCRPTARDLAPGTLDHLNLIRTLDVRNALATTAHPLLVISTTHDRLVDPAHSADIVRIRPDAIHITLDSGHAAGDEAGESWADALKWFFHSVT